MKKLNIERPMLDYRERTGKTMTKTRLGSLVWEEKSKNAQRVGISNLISGKTKRIDIETAEKLCDALEIDYNTLFNYKK